jgi:hypothetical protein
MFDFSDARVYGILSILLILVIGYFVYLMYSDLVVLKKQVSELLTDDFPENGGLDGIDFGDDDDDEGEEELEEEEPEEEPAPVVGDDEALATWERFTNGQGSELERHLSTIMESANEEEMSFVQEPTKPVKQRKPRAKKAKQEKAPEPETTQPQIEELVEEE